MREVLIMHFRAFEEVQSGRNSWCQIAIFQTILVLVHSGLCLSRVTALIFPQFAGRFGRSLLSLECSTLLRQLTAAPAYFLPSAHFILVQNFGIAQQRKILQRYQHYIEHAEGQLLATARTAVLEHKGRH